MEHPAVVETAVISSPDPIRGEVMGELQPLGVKMVVKGMDLGVGQSGSKSWSCCLLAVCPWASYLASLCFSSSHVR